MSTRPAEIRKIKPHRVKKTFYETIEPWLFLLPALCVFGVFSAIVIYGGIMNPASVLMWANADTLTWKTVLTYYVTGFPMDCVHASATVFFLLIAAEPMLEKLDRIKLKYGLME